MWFSSQNKQQHYLKDRAWAIKPARVGINTETQADPATYRLNWPRGQFSGNGRTR